jgi:hypothetical protein
MSPVVLSLGGGYQAVDRLAQQFLHAVSEHLAGSGIGKSDPSPAVDGYQGVRRTLDQGVQDRPNFGRIEPRERFV